MRSSELEQFITELRGENPVSHVVTNSESKMVLIIEDTDERHEFKADEARLILSSVDSVRRFFDVLDYPEEAFVEFYGIEVEPDVMSELETFASSVDDL